MEVIIAIRVNEVFPSQECCCAEVSALTRHLLERRRHSVIEIDEDSDGLSRSIAIKRKVLHANVVMQDPLLLVEIVST